MIPVMRDGNGEGEKMRCGHFQRGGEARRSMVSEVDDTMNSGTTVGEVEGGSWCLEVEDDQRKLGWLAKYVVGLNC
jgi:hypothetical protein